MADDVFVKFGGDTSSLQAQIAVATSRFSEFSGQLRAAAREAVGAGSQIDSVLNSRLNDLAGKTSEAKTHLAELVKQLHEGSGGFLGLGGEIKHVVALFDEFARGARGSMISSIGAMIRDSGGLSVAIAGLIGTAGLALLANRLRETAVSMAELGERTVNMAAAVGTTPNEISKLSGALKLATGDALESDRTLERIGKNLETALTQPASEAAKAATSLGITQAELKRASTDLGYALDLLADKFVEFENSPLKSADFLALTGRTMDQLVPVFKRGSDGIHQLMEEAKALGIVLTDQDAEALAQTDQKIHELGVTIEGAGVQMFLRWKSEIDSVIDSLRTLIGLIGPAINAVKGILSIEQSIEGFMTKPFRDMGLIGGDSASGAKGPDASITLPDVTVTPKPQVGAWPEKEARGGGGRGGGDPAREEAEIFAAGERLKIQEAKDSADQIQAIYTEWLAEVAQVYGKDSTQYLNLEREKVAAAQRAAEERVRLAEQAERQQEEFERRLAEEQVRAAEQAARAWDHTVGQISDQFATMADDLITRTKTMTQIMADLFKSLLNDVLKSTFKDLFNTVLTGSAGGLTGSTGGGGGGGIVGSLINGLFGKIGGAAGGGLLGLIGLGGGSQTLVSTATDFAGGQVGGGLFGSLFAGLGSLFAFSKGGIVPSAAGGWSVPQLGPGGTLAQLHSNEMVLPANISQGLQGMIANGGGPSVGVNFSVSAMDSQSVATFFRSNGATLVAAINQAVRNGSMLRGTS